MHLVMFDVDGTLTDTNELDADCYVEAVSEILRLAPIDRDWSRYNHVTDSGIAQEIIEAHFAGRCADSELERIKRRFVELLRDRLLANPLACRPIGGAREMLSLLAERGDHAIALATGGWKESAQLKLHVAGFPADRLTIASADDSTERERIMSIAQQRAGQGCRCERFSSRTYVGDGLWDLLASRRLGLPFIAIAAGPGADKLKASGADRVLPDFSDHRRFLEMLEAIQRSPNDM